MEKIIKMSESKFSKFFKTETRIVRKNKTAWFGDHFYVIQYRKWWSPVWFEIQWDYSWIPVWPFSIPKEFKSEEEAVKELETLINYTTL